MSNTKRFKKHTNINLRNIKQHQTIISVLKSELLKIISSKIIEFNFNFNSAKTNIEVERSKSSNHGDYCSNIAIMLFSNLEQRIMFAKMVSNLLPFSIVEFSEISSNGFINMFINKKFLFKILNIVLTEKDKYGEFGIKRKEFYNIEFVSANPTGLLHIGHARNAAIGDVLSNIWKMYGITVNKEYYINDGGNQINNLGVSLLVRYKQCLGVQAEMPLDAYHGQEIIPIAKELISEIGDRYIDVSQDDHRNIKTKSIINFFANYAKDCLLDLIKLDLADLGINFDIWFSESSLYQDKLKLVTSVLSILSIHTYKKDGALWLNTAKFGDDKDRVLVKTDGNFTYFTPDIVYHYIKLSRGYTKIFNLWGSDHASYANRLCISMQLLGFKKEQINILIMQMIKLTENGKEFIMSKRTGNSLTLRDLMQLIGKDAARWYLVSQPLSSHLEIDVAKAKTQNNDNPIYYVQYAHARINQLIHKAKELFQHLHKPKSFKFLVTQEESDLANMILYFKHTIELIANRYEANKMTIYLTSLARLFHSYYGNTKILDSKNERTSLERLFLVIAVQQVIKNGLKIIGIKAIESM